MKKFWMRLAAVVGIGTGVAVVFAAVSLYTLLKPKYQDRLLDPTGPVQQLSRQGQHKVSIYDSGSRTYSKPMPRHLAEAELASGLHRGGQIATVRGLPEIDATDIVIVLDKPINPIVVRQPRGAIVEGKLIGAEAVAVDRH